MAKFKNELNKSDVVTALMRWATGVDGHNGDIGGIIDEIPWSAEMDKVAPWDSVIFDNATPDSIIGDSIGNRPSNAMDAIYEFITDEEDLLKTAIESRKKLIEWANEEFEKINNAYSRLITELNNRWDNQFKYVGHIRLFTSIDGGGVCQYEEFNTLYGKTKYDLISQLYHWLKYHKELTGCGYKLSKWEVEPFFDALYEGTAVHCGTFKNKPIDMIVKSNTTM